jgi:hypothetical protein
MSSPASTKMSQWESMMDIWSEGVRGRTLLGVAVNVFQQRTSSFAAFSSRTVLKPLLRPVSGIDFVVRNRIISLHRSKLMLFALYSSSTLPSSSNKLDLYAFFSSLLALFTDASSPTQNASSASFIASSVPSLLLYDARMLTFSTFLFLQRRDRSRPRRLHLRRYLLHRQRCAAFLLHCSVTV